MVARAEKTGATRKRITEAALRLFLDKPFEEVTLQMIAEASGVSHQTVLNHFESKEGVAAAGAELLAQRTAAARGKAIPNDIGSVVSVLVDDYERIGDANARWAASAEKLGPLSALLDDARAGHQAWLGHMFAKHLPAGRRRLHSVNTLHAATDVYVWKLLRRDLGLSRRETQAVMEALVRGAIGKRVRAHPRKAITG